ncbi:MAG TPA: hypothetical protein VGQ29_02080 [Gemmatimonadales bacterium]|nr:hypothetical protein [Gemmatimonadales bacterium]
MSANDGTVLRQRDASPQQDQHCAAHDRRGAPHPIWANEVFEDALMRHEAVESDGSGAVSPVSVLS